MYFPFCHSTSWLVSDIDGMRLTVLDSLLGGLRLCSSWFAGIVNSYDSSAKSDVPEVVMLPEKIMDSLQDSLRSDNSVDNTVKRPSPELLSSREHLREDDKF